MSKALISTYDQDRQYIDDFRKGNIELGLDCGFIGEYGLDSYFRFKRGNFVGVNGYANLGKTTAILYLWVLYAKKHNLKFLVYANENKTADIRMSLCEFYTSKMVGESLLQYREKPAILSDAELYRANKWVDEHFLLLYTEDGSALSYKDVFETAYRSKGIDGLLLDPYNGLKVRTDYCEKTKRDFSKMSEHKYLHEFCNDSRVFIRATNTAIWVNAHPHTGSARAKTEDGLSVAPTEHDTYGGSILANRVDDFLTIHRNKNDPENYMWTEVHVRKIKDSRTGGRPTPQFAPFKMKFKGVGFEDEAGMNPMYKIDNSKYTYEPTDLLE
jgi:hypothetical protein